MIKTFSIEINGISLSEDAVASLILKLNQLEERINSLSDADTSDLKKGVEDIKKSLAEQGEDWDNISDKVKEVTDKIDTLDKACEALENPFKVQDVQRYNKEVESLEGSISDVSNKANNLGDLKGFDLGIKNASNSAEKLAQSLNKAATAEDLLGTKVTTNISGMSLTFDDTNQAIGILEDKLYLLANAGKRGGSEFKLITAEIVKMKQAVKSVDAEIDNAFSGGLNNLLEGVGSISAIASIGEGLGALFGVKELDESLLKFAQLALILQGVKELLMQLNNEASLTSKIFRTLSSVADPFVSGMTKGFNKLFPQFEKFNKYATSLKVLDLTQQMNKFAEAAALDKKNTAAWDDLAGSLADISIELAGIGSLKGTEQLVTQFSDLSTVSKQVKLAFDEGLINEEQFNKANVIIERVKNQLSESSRQAGNFRQQLQGMGIIIDEDNVLPLTFMQKGLIKVSKGIKMVGLAFKALLKSTIILGLIQAAVEAITWAFEQLGKIWTKFAGDDSLINLMDATKNAIDATNKSVETYIKNLLKLEDTKVISAYTRIKDSVLEYNKALLETIKRQQELNKFSGLGEKTLNDFFNTWANGTTFFSESIDDMDDFKRRYETLLKAVQSGKDELGGKGWFASLWFTASDARADLAILQKALVDDLLNKINNLDLSKGTAELEGLIKLMEDPMYAQAIANIENLYPDDGVGKVLAANIKQIRDYYDTIKDLQHQAELETLKSLDTINDNNIAAIKDRFTRERAELENNHKKELRDAADNEALKNSITKKYDLQRQQLLKLQGNEVRDIRNKIANDEIASLEDSLAKRLAAIEQARKEEIQLAGDSEILVAELVKAINDKYNREILDAKKEFYKSRLELTISYKEQLRDLEAEIAEIEYEIATSRVSNRADKSIEDLGYSPESLLNIKDYFLKVRDIENAEASKLAELDKEHSRFLTEQSLADEKERHRQQLKALEDNLESGLASKEMYDKAVQDETDQHYQMLAAITRKGEQDLINIQNEANETIKNNNATALNERINLISNTQSQIQAQVKVTKLGIIDFKESKAELKAAKSAYSLILKEIGTERDKLQESFDKKEISFNDFRLAKEELDSLEKDTLEASENVGFELGNLIGNTIQSITQYIGQYVGVLGGLWSTYNEILMAQIDQEQARLDREYEVLEEAYNKQELLTKKHTDKLEGIEDELATARGDRRAHLIEQLNAERAAMLDSLAEELKIEQLKEANKKKQDALEKKRREQEKKNSIVQATINTFTAVTNALAVQPWFVGLALSAVALAMGMANVAQIKKQKYAKGGLLQGKSHSLGGIPVGDTGIEVEGNEYIVNKKSTSKNLPLIDYINSSNKLLTKDDLVRWYDSSKNTVKASTKKTFADGGILPNVTAPSTDNTIVITDDRPIVAQIVDIVNSADNYREILVLSGLSGKKV